MAAAAPGTPVRNQHIPNRTTPPDSPHLIVRALKALKDVQSDESSAARRLARCEGGGKKEKCTNEIPEQSIIRYEATQTIRQQIRNRD